MTMCQAFTLHNKMKALSIIPIIWIICCCNNGSHPANGRDSYPIPCNGAKNAIISIDSLDSSLLLSACFYDGTESTIKTYKSQDNGKSWAEQSCHSFDGYIHLTKEPQKRDNIFISPDGKYILRRRQESTQCDTLLRYDKKADYSSLNMTDIMVADNLLAVKCGWSLLFYKMSNDSLQFISSLEKPSNFGSRIPTSFICTNGITYLTVRNMASPYRQLSYVSFDKAQTWHILGGYRIDTALGENHYSLIGENGRYNLEHSKVERNFYD